MIDGRFPYKKLAKYPHLKPEDIAVWELFIEQNPTEFLTCNYDVACGVGAPQDPSLPENIQRDGKILTQKKIDVVGYINNDITIIELKPIANARALGQLLTYKDLYIECYPDHPTPKMMVIANSIEREMQATFDAQGIVVRTV